MPFIYRLQKILNLRIQKKKEQLQVVLELEREINRIQEKINQNKNTIFTLRKNMYSAPHIMLENYDIYIRYLNDIIEQLEEEKSSLVQRKQEEMKKLEEMEKGIKALEKHKEKVYEEYLEEQNKTEMRIMDETAGLRHYAKTEEE
ncbi:MAG: flagellar FliJ family protein [bacterium]